jgi:hypothetical protein
MFISKMHLSRRTFLRGTLGTAIALPFLDAMVPALTAQSRTAANAPLRFGAMYFPCGVWPDSWHPEQTGKDFEFKPVMKPLEPLRDYVVTVSQMRAPFVSVHLGASACWLNGVGPAVDEKVEGRGDAYGKIRSKKTVDQFIADKWAGDTPLRSIEVGTEDMGTAAGACDGFACAFFNTLAWHDDSSPLPVGINPRVTFERLFGDAGSSQQRAAGLKTKQSLLDSVVGETSKLQKKLGPADKAILDQYLTNVRRVEEQLDRMEARIASLPEGVDAPVGIPEVFDDHMTVTYDILHLAYQADLTRVFSFLLGHEASTRSYAHIGVPEAHHSISHHGGDPEKLSKYAKIGTYHIVKMAEFLEKCKDTKDGDGTLLDHMLVYWGSGMSNGNAHDRQNVPAVLVGGANGNMKGNRHIAVEKDTPTANLLLGIAHAAGVEVDKMGASTGKIDLA